MRRHPDGAAFPCRADGRGLCVVNHLMRLAAFAEAALAESRSCASLLAKHVSYANRIRGRARRTPRRPSS